MRKKLNLLRFVLMLLALPLLAVSCGDKDKANGDNNLAPSIATLSPESGVPGDVITITGSGFGTDKSNVVVSFNTTKATNIISVTDTKIEVQVPAGFSDQAVQVKVSVSGVASGGKLFQYLDTALPLITSLTATCFPGATVVIEGNNFSTNIAENIVKFGNVEAAVTAATKTTLRVVAPDLGTATSVAVTVTKFGTVSNSRNITVDADQHKVATHTWTTHTVKPGVVYKTGTLSLFGGNQRIYILDVTLNASNTMHIGFTTDDKATVTMCKSYGAVAGINAGYFPFGGTVDKDPYIRIDGETKQVGHTSFAVHFGNAALLIHNNVATVRRLGTSGTNWNQLASLIPVSEAENVIVCGPMLITDGEIGIVSPTNSHNTNHTSRTGLGVSADGKRVYMVVADSDSGATLKGMTSTHLAKVLQALGAVSAMNFDGGGSSTMFVDGQGDNGRVNFPYGGTYQRPVRSVIYVK